MVEIVTLTPNPALDVSTSAWKVQPTEKLRCTEPRRDPGGGGINVARAAKRLGARTLAIYPAGGAVGALLTRLLTTEGVACHPVPAVAQTRENFCVLEQETGLQYKFVLPGPPLSQAEQLSCLSALSEGEQWADYVVLSGSLPPGAGPDFFARAAASARGVGAEVVLDTSGAALLAGLEHGTDIVKPSLAELRDLMGRSLETEAEQLRAARDLVETGKAKMVALTLGANGALLVSAHGAWRSQPPRIDPVSSVGAGDSFLAGLLVKFGEGASPADALRFATAAGAAALLAPGVELCRAEDVHRLEPHVTVAPCLAAAGADQPSEGRRAASDAAAAAGGAA